MEPLNTRIVEETIVGTVHEWLAGSYVNLPDAHGPQFKVTLDEDGTLDFSPVDPEAVHPDDARGSGWTFRVIVEKQYQR